MGFDTSWPRAIKVFVESGAGQGIGLSDGHYRKAGAMIVSGPEEVFGKSQMIVKVKEPIPEEMPLLRPHHILYTYLHLAANRRLTEGLMERGLDCVAYETIQEKDGPLPLLIPMSEVAGRMAAQVGASYLQLDHGGKGILLGGVPGTRQGRVTVLGLGAAGINAVKMAVGLGGLGDGR